MTKQKKENRGRRRKTPIPPVSAHPTKKQKQLRERKKWSEKSDSF